MFASRENDIIWVLAGIIIFVIATVIQKMLIKTNQKESKKVERDKKVFLYRKAELVDVPPDVANAIVEGLNKYFKNESGKRFMVRSIKNKSNMDLI